MIQIPKKLGRYLPNDRPFSEIEAAFSIGLIFQAKIKLTHDHIRTVWGWDPSKDLRKINMVLQSLGLERDDDGTLQPQSDDVYITKKGRLLSGKRLESFNEFWKTFAYAHGKAEAADAWLDIRVMTGKLFKQILHAAEVEAKRRPEIIKSGRTPKMAQGWISARRWEDESYDPAANAESEKRAMSDDEIERRTR